jgi:dethiobiotin synthetase
MRPLFVTGIGTGVGKTIWSAVLTEALQADYWKPVQSGYEDGTDAASVSTLVSNPGSCIHKEVYNLRLPASPHIAAREEGIRIDLAEIRKAFDQLPCQNDHIVIEGAGGIMVPVNDHDFILDMALALDADVLLVSRNYLGSINHSLLTAHMARSRGLKVLGWLFNDQFMDYEEEIVHWSGYPKIASLPFSDVINRDFVRLVAEQCRTHLATRL